MANNETTQKATEKGIEARTKLGKIVKSVPFIGTVCTMLGIIIGFLAGLMFGKKQTAQEIDAEYGVKPIEDAICDGDVSVAD